MMHLGVIGIGNDTRGDDAIGLVVARCLQHDTPEGVTVQEVHGEGLSVLERWQGADAIILIDASHSGAAPGTIHRLEPLTQPLPRDLFPCSTHAFGVVEAIELARVLGQLPPHLVVYGIEASQFDIGSDLSEGVRQAVPEVVRQVQRDIQELQRQEMGENRYA